MNRFVVLCVFVSACGPSAPLSNDSSAVAAARRGSADIAEQGAFALVVRGDTTIKEEYSRTSAALRGVLHPTMPGAKFGWTRYEVEFSSGNFVKRARLDLARDGSSTVAASWLFTIQDGVLKERDPGGTETQLRAGRDVIPVFAPSMVMFHEVIRRALPQRRTLGTVRIPVFALATGTDRVDTVNVEWITVDTAAVSWGERPEYFGVDADGRILGSRPDHFTYVRTR